MSHEDFNEQLEPLKEELWCLNAEVHELQATIAGNVAEILAE